MKKNISILYAMSLLQGMVFYGPIATLYRQAQGVSVFQITIIESISLALGVILEIPWGVVADRIGYRRTMVFCSVLYFVSKIVFWQADSFADFLLERVLLSVVLAGLSGVDTSILYLSCKGQDSQRVFGIYNSLSMAGLLAAAGVFSWLVQDNYALAGWLTVLSYGAAAVLSFGITEVKEKRTDRAAEEPFRVTLKKTLSDRSLLLFLVAAALFSETHQTITVFLNQLQYERCGLTDTGIGLVYIVGTVLGTLGVYSATVTRQAGMRGAFLLFCGLGAASCLVLAGTGSVLLSVGSVLTLRVCNTLFQPFCAQLQNQQIQTENRATALSIHAMWMNGIAIGTNLIFGALSDRSLPAAFAFGAGICVISLLLFLFWQKRSAR